jgi:hypothetical protein
LPNRAPARRNIIRNYLAASTSGWMDDAREYLGPVEAVVVDVLDRPGEHHVLQIHLPHVAAERPGLPRSPLASTRANRRHSRGEGGGGRGLVLRWCWLAVWRRRRRFGTVKAMVVVAVLRGEKAEQERSMEGRGWGSVQCTAQKSFACGMGEGECFWGLGIRALFHGTGEWTAQVHSATVQLAARLEPVLATTSP